MEAGEETLARLTRVGKAQLRDIVIQGTYAAAAIQKHLVLLSVCHTCKYMGVDFLDLLRSGEKDIQAFAESRRSAGGAPSPANRMPRQQTIRSSNPCSSRGDEAHSGGGMQVAAWLISALRRLMGLNSVCWPTDSRPG